MYFYSDVCINVDSLRSLRDPVKRVLYGDLSPTCIKMRATCCASPFSTASTLFGTAESPNRNEGVYKARPQARDRTPAMMPLGMELICSACRAPSP